MTRVRRWRSLTATLAYFNVAWNLMLFALNPAWGSMVLALIWLLAGAFCTGSLVIDKRRTREAERHHPIFFKVPGGPVKAARPVMLSPGERMTPLPSGWKVVELPRGGRHYIQECSHWPRDEVKLNDGTTVAYICRRCDHNWANEDYVRQGVR